jgi:hypothetical protein
MYSYIGYTGDRLDQSKALQVEFPKMVKEATRIGGSETKVDRLSRRKQVLRILQTGVVVGTNLPKSPRS